MATETTIDAFIGTVAPAAAEKIETRETLVERLSGLESFLKSGRKYELQHSADEVIAARTKVLREYFQENPLAGKVFRGEDSYAQRIRPILEKYRGFWSRYFTTRHEPEHDRYVQEVLASINGVGVHSLEAGSFITENKNEETLAMMGGGLAAGTTGCAVALLTMPDLDFLTAAIVAVPFAAAGAILLPVLARNTIYRPHLLSQAAKQTDDYLANIPLIKKEQV